MKLDREDMMEAVAQGVRDAFIALGTNHRDLDVPAEIVHDAIRKGTADAMWRLFTNATDMPCSDFYEAIKQGTKDAVAGLKRP